MTHYGKGSGMNLHGNSGFWSRPELRPDLHGAHSNTWRQGSAAINTDAPPSWAPEMAFDTTYPYGLEEWAKEVSRWMVATKVSAERQGPRLALAMGGAARNVADDIGDDLLVNGAMIDLGDGAGPLHRSGAQLLVRALKRNPR